MNTKDVEIIEKLKELVYKAETQYAKEYEETYYPYSTDKFERYAIIQECLNGGFKEIYDEYWELTNQLSFKVEKYTLDIPFYRNIMAYHNALLSQIENINVDEIAPTKSIDKIYNDLITNLSIEHLCLLKAKIDKYINNNI